MRSKASMHSRPRHLSVVLGLLPMGLAGCGTLGQTVSMPFALLDGAVLIATLGTVDPGLGMTVEDAIDKGKLSARGSINSYDPEMASMLISPLAESVNQYATTRQAAPQPPGSAPKTIAAAKTVAPTATYNAPMGTLASSNTSREGANPYSASNSHPPAAPSNASHTGKTYRLAENCVQLSNEKSTSYTAVVNNCGFPVLVTYYDSKGVHTAWGMDGIKPGRWELMPRVVGQYKLAACEYPASPRGPAGGKWSGSGSYVCRL